MTSSTSDIGYSRTDTISSEVARIRAEGLNQHELDVLDLMQAGAVYRDNGQWVVDFTFTADILHAAGLCWPSTDPNGNTHMLATVAGEQALMDADSEQAEVHQAYTGWAVRRAAALACLATLVVIGVAAVVIVSLTN